MISRRYFLRGTALAGGGLAVIAGTRLPDLRGRIRQGLAADPLGDEDAWVQIDPDGTTTIRVAAVEMGQGATSALAQVLCEELDADWTQVQVESAPASLAFAGPSGHLTAGSNSVRGQFERMRLLGASARSMLVATAADRWGAPPAECTTQTGRVLHEASGRSVPYGELATDAARQPAPESPTLKARSQWSLVGRPLPLANQKEKVDGTICYGMDLKFPDMLVAAVTQSPSAGSRLAGVERAAALAQPGVVDIVTLDDTVAVLARQYWQADRGLKAAAVQWEPGTEAGMSSDQVIADLRQAVTTPTTTLVSGSPQAAEAIAAVGSSSDRVEATYTAPFLMHMQLEPLNATARVGRWVTDVWVPTQAQSQMRSAVARAVGVHWLRVNIHTPPLGGGFGRRLETDYGVTAARIAKEAGTTVKAIWSREDDSRQARMRPASATRLAAVLNDRGLIDSLRVDIASVGDWPRTAAFLPNAYAIGRQAVFTAQHTPGIRVGSWRSVDLSQNCFFLESFIDECAATAGIDPLDYRLQLLPQDPRARRLLEAVAAMSGWHDRQAQGRHLGLAFSPGFGSLTAMVIELSSAPAGGWRVGQIFVAVDCGTAVNPLNIEAQVQGGALMGLSAALHEQAVVSGGRVETLNFDRYPILRMTDAPAITVRLLDSPEAPIGGVGEVGVPPVAPALANALYAATGRRVRELPLARSLAS